MNNFHCIPGNSFSTWISKNEIIYLITIFKIKNKLFYWIINKASNYKDKVNKLNAFEKKKKFNLIL